MTPERCHLCDRPAFMLPSRTLFTTADAKARGMRRITTRDLRCYFCGEIAPRNDRDPHGYRAHGSCVEAAREADRQALADAMASGLCTRSQRHEHSDDCAAHRVDWRARALAAEARVAALLTPDGGES